MLAAAVSSPPAPAGCASLTAAGGGGITTGAAPCVAIGRAVAGAARGSRPLHAATAATITAATLKFIANQRARPTLHSRGPVPSVTVGPPYLYQQPLILCRDRLRCVAYR